MNKSLNVNVKHKCIKSAIENVQFRQVAYLYCYEANFRGV